MSHYKFFINFQHKIFVNLRNIVTFWINYSENIFWKKLCQTVIYGYVKKIQNLTSFSFLVEEIIPPNFFSEYHYQKADLFLRFTNFHTENWWKTYSGSFCVKEKENINWGGQAPSFNYLYHSKKWPISNLNFQNKSL